uniref:PLA2G12A n=1 Tax=Callithrix jacchus TaxID=9483 RepID=A0A8I3W5X5_CALJA
MALLPRPALILLLLLMAAVVRCQEQAQTTDWRATLKTIRNDVHKIHKYLNAALDLLGGKDGLCQYECSDADSW